MSNSAVDQAMCETSATNPAYNTSQATLELTDIKVSFPVLQGFLQRTRGYLQAVRGVSFSVEGARTTALVGESGSGKSTIARCIAGAMRPTSGSIKLGDINLEQGRDGVGAKVNVHKLVQMVLQNPYDSLNPYMTVVQLIEEGMIVNRTVTKSERRDRTMQLLQAVGLSPDLAQARPRGLSGGQRQRVAIARALAVNPSVLLLDEAVSALDVSVQAQILELLSALQKRFGTTYLFITHDLSILQQISQKIVVLYLGLVMETGPTSSMLLNPLHPYTSALVASSYGRAGAPGRTLVLDQGLGEVPSALNPPSGCPYRTRCPRAESICAAEQPPLRAVAPSRAIACHFPLEPSQNGTSA